MNMKEDLYIPNDEMELIDRMKNKNFKGEIHLEKGIIYWKTNEKEVWQIILNNNPDEAYVIVPSGAHDHVPHDELWEYLESINDEINQ